MWMRHVLWMKDLTVADVERMAMGNKNHGHNQWAAQLVTATHEHDISPLFDTVFTIGSARSLPQGFLVT